MSSIRFWERGLSGARDVEQRTGLNSLGVIPRAPAALAAAHLPPAALVVVAPASPYAQAVRALRPALFRGPPGRPAKVVALTSALPGDGKTTCSLSLARQSAVEGFRTVLVDCDLRRPSLTAQMACPPQTGLLEIIEDGASLDEALHPDTLTELRLLPASRSDAEIAPAIVRDLFGGPAMDALMDRLRESFDHVYLDTPPVLPVADTLRLVSLSDAVLILSRWRRSPARAVVLALRRLNRTSANLVGLALTRGPERESPLAARVRPWAQRIRVALGDFDACYGGSFARRAVIALIPPAAVLCSNLAFCAPTG